MSVLQLGIWILSTVWLAGGAPAAAESDRSVQPLPKPVPVGRMSLEEAIGQRRSVREFTETPLTNEQIGQLCWAAQGITSATGHRTAPSAGGTYPLELLVATANGCFAYDPPHHRLIRRTEDDLRPALQWAALGQPAVGRGAAVFIIAAVPSRTTGQYHDRGVRYVHLEAGHAAQNLLLEAAALELGAVPVGAFDDARLLEVLDLNGDHHVLYLIPVGVPRE